MGNRQVKYVDENNHYFCVSFAPFNKIRIIGAPADIVEQTESKISSLWQIDDIHKLPGFSEIKLKSSAMNQSLTKFLGVTDDMNSLQFKFLVCHLLKYYYSAGWHILCSPVLQYFGDYGSTIVFEKDKPIETEIIALDFSHSDRIRFLGPDNLVPYIRETINNFWEKGLKDEKKYDNSWQFELKGSPWSKSTFKEDECSNAPVLVMELLRCLNKLNWHSCATIYSGNFNQGLYFRYLPNTSESNHDYFSLVLNGSDSLVLVRPIPNLIDLINNCFSECWHRGIKYQKQLKDSFYKFKLNGTPWNCSKEDRVDSRKTINSLLGNLLTSNCELCSVCTYSDRISTFFFKFNRSNNSILLPKAVSSNMFSLSLNSTDKIQIIEMNNNLSCLADLLRNAIVDGYPKGIQKENDDYNAHEFKLKGNPFECDLADTVDISVLLMFILKKFKDHNINFVCSADLSNEQMVGQRGIFEVDYEDIHTLFFKMN